MSLRRITFTLFLLYFLIIACKDEKTSKAKDPVGITEVLVPSTESQGKLNQKNILTDSVFVVKLELNEQSIIGKIDKLLFSNNDIYLIDKRRSKKLFQFTLDGKLIRTIGKNGKGPGEYISINGFALDKKRDEIVIYDGKGKKIITYDKTGNLLSEVKLKIRGSNLALKDSSYIIDIDNFRQNKSNNNRFSIAAINDEGKTLSKFLIEDRKVQKLIGTNNLFTYKSDVFFKTSFGNTIYSILEDQAIPVVKFLFEDESIPDTLFEKFTEPNSFIDEVKSKEYAHVTNKLFINDKFLGFSVRKGNSRQRYLYSFNTKKMYFLNNLEIMGFPVGFYNDFIVTSISPQNFHIFAKLVKDQKIKKILNESKLDDNPLLLFTKLKPNL